MLHVPHSGSFGTKPAKIIKQTHFKTDYYINYLTIRTVHIEQCLIGIHKELEITLTGLLTCTGARVGIRRDLSIHHYES